MPLRELLRRRSEPGAALREAVGGDANQLVPEFIVRNLPVGLTGLVLAAIMAASMSSLDSALNSMSASTLRDFVEPALKKRGAISDRTVLTASKLTTVFWGAVITGFAFFVGNISDTIVEGINLIGSLFYGPILAAFLIGVLDRRARGPAIIAGIIAGVGINLLLAFPDVAGIDVFWMWWNATGLVVAVVVTFVGSRLMAPPAREKIETTTLSVADLKGEAKWLSTYIWLAVYAAAIIALAFFCDDLLARFM